MHGELAHPALSRIECHQVTAVHRDRRHHALGGDPGGVHVSHQNVLATDRGLGQQCHRDGRVHPDIAVEGTAGDFSVTLIKKPRYVIADSCTGCPDGSSTRTDTNTTNAFLST